MMSEHKPSQYVVLHGYRSHTRKIILELTIIYNFTAIILFFFVYFFFLFQVFVLFLNLSWCKGHATLVISPVDLKSFDISWAASSEFGTYRLCEQRRFRRACASAQSRQNLRCSLKQAVSQEKPSDRKPDPWPL